MKRMYVTLIIIILLVSWAGISIGQKVVGPSDLDMEARRMELRMKKREEMHRKLMDKIIKGIGEEEDIFKDMESLFDLNDFGPSSLSSISSNYRSEWIEDAQGKTLVITPKSPEQKLDINVKDDFVTISGTSEVKSASGTSVSNFSNAFSVPFDCDGSKVKMDQKEGKIHISFPFKTARKVVPKVDPKNDRKPLPPLENEVTI